MSTDPHTLDHADTPNDATPNVLHRWHQHHMRRFHGGPPSHAATISLIELGGYHDAAHVREREANN